MGEAVNLQPNLNEVRCTVLQDGSTVRLSVRRSPNSANVLEIVAAQENGDPLYPEMADRPHLKLSRAEMGTNANKWLPEHVHMLGAPRGNGLSNAFLDFATDVVGLNLVRADSLSPERDMARGPFDAWQARRAQGGQTQFAHCQ